MLIPWIKKQKKTWFLFFFDQFPRCADENVIILDDISFSYTEFDALELGELTSSVNNE